MTRGRTSSASPCLWSLSSERPTGQHVEDLLPTTEASGTGTSGPETTEGDVGRVRTGDGGTFDDPTPGQPDTDASRPGSSKTTVIDHSTTVTQRVMPVFTTTGRTFHGSLSGQSDR